MARLRTLLIWLLVFALPLQAAAAVSMMQCKDMQASSASADAPAHDHAAMMKAMAEGEQIPAMSQDMHAGMDHGEMDHSGMALASDHQPESKSVRPGCDCGCECLASCSVGCTTGVTASVSLDGYSVFQSSPTQVVFRRAEVHPAYCDDPLRPPSAVA
jgi:hypothetical protein